MNPYCGFPSVRDELATLHTKLAITLASRSQAGACRKVAPNLWTGDVVPLFDELSGVAKFVGVYLLTSPHANMLGLYHQPFEFIMGDTGLDEEMVRDALDELEAARFISYDEELEYVWVRYFIPTQHVDSTHPKLGRVESEEAQRVFDSLEGAPFREELYDMFHEVLGISLPH